MKKSVLRNVAVIRLLPFQNNLKDLDPSFKTDLDLWDCFGSKNKLCLITEEIRYFLLKNGEELLYCQTPHVFQQKGSVFVHTACWKNLMSR